MWTISISQGPTCQLPSKIMLGRQFCQVLLQEPARNIYTEEIPHLNNVSAESIEYSRRHPKTVCSNVRKQCKCIGFKFIKYYQRLHI